MRRNHTQKEKELHYKIEQGFAWIYIALAILLVLLNLGLVAYWEPKNQQEDLITIKAKVSGDVTYLGERSSTKHHHGTGQRLNGVKLWLQGYRGYTFLINQNGVQAMRRNDFLKSVHKGDSIYVEVRKDVYEKKLLQHEPVNFWDRIFPSDEVVVYGIRQSEKVYLTLDKYNQERSYWNVYINIFSFILLAFFIGKYVSAWQDRRLEGDSMEFNARDFG